MQFGKDFKVAYEFEKTTFLFREKRFSEQVVGSHPKVICKTLKHDNIQIGEPPVLQVRVRHNRVISGFFNSEYC